MSLCLMKCFLFLGALYTSNALLDTDISLLKAMSDMNTTVQQLVTSNAALATSNVELNATLQKTSVKIVQLEQEVQHLRNAVKTSPVVFCAKLTRDLNLGQYQAIEFDHVITNIGNAYDPRHGHFVAPVAGYYHLSTTIMSLPHQHLDIDMVKNGNTIVQLYGSVDEYDTGTANIDITLAPGDMVWVRHITNNQQTIHGDYSFYSGFLISEI